jgi:hypothetical protein
VVAGSQLRPDQQSPTTGRFAVAHQPQGAVYLYIGLPFLNFLMAFFFFGRPLHVARAWASWEVVYSTPSF